MTSGSSDQTQILMGYRYCEEDFQPGHIEQAKGDHLPDLSPDKQRAEIVIREGDKRGALRGQATYVFEKLEVALRLLNETNDKHLFELSINANDIVHRADLRIYDEIVAALKNGENVDELVTEFWEGVERPDPRIELCIVKAKIVRKVVDANTDERNLFAWRAN